MVSAAFLLLAIRVAVAAQTGYVQVKAEAGLMVFLDGTFKGRTDAALRGLIIEDVPSGWHELRIVKKGFQPKGSRIRVEAGKVFVYTVGVLSPAVKVTQAGEGTKETIRPKTGGLIVQSLPVDCKVSIPSLRINAAKNKDQWKVEAVPPGRYHATFSAMGRNLQYTVEIQADVTVGIMVNFLKKSVQVTSRKSLAEERRRAEEARRAQARIYRLERAPFVFHKRDGSKFVCDKLNTGGFLGWLPLVGYGDSKVIWLFDKNLKSIYSKPAKMIYSVEWGSTSSWVHITKEKVAAMAQLRGREGWKYAIRSCTVEELAGRRVQGYIPYGSEVIKRPRFQKPYRKYHGPSVYLDGAWHEIADFSKITRKED